MGTGPHKSASNIYTHTHTMAGRGTEYGRTVYACIYCVR